VTRERFVQAATALAKQKLIYGHVLKEKASTGLVHDCASFVWRAMLDAGVVPIGAQGQTITLQNVSMSAGWMMDRFGKAKTARLGDLAIYQRDPQTDDERKSAEENGESCVWHVAIVVADGVTLGMLDRGPVRCGEDELPFKWRLTQAPSYRTPLP
jgi:hypothetical protein